MFLPDLNKDAEVVVVIIVCNYKSNYDKVQRTTSRLHDFTTYDFTTFTTVRLLIDLETHFCTVNPVSRSIKSREVVKVVKS